MSITVYSRPTEVCVKCLATELALKRRGIDFDKVLLDENPEALEYVRSLGYTVAPVVVVTDNGKVVDHWSDYRHDKIANLALRASA